MRSRTPRTVISVFVTASALLASTLGAEGPPAPASSPAAARVDPVKDALKELGLDLRSQARTHGDDLDEALKPLDARAFENFRVRASSRRSPGSAWSAPMESLLSEPVATGDLQKAKSDFIAQIQKECGAPPKKALIAAAIDAKALHDLPDLPARLETFRFDGIQPIQAAGAAGSVAAASPVTELLTLIAQIAIERAKRDGLALAQERLSTAVCNIQVETLADKPADKKIYKAFPSTCELLTKTSIERIVADPNLLRVALVSDLTSNVTEQALAFIDEPGFRQLVSAILRALQGGLSRQPPGFSAGDACIIADAVVYGPWVTTRLLELSPDYSVGLTAAWLCLGKRGLCTPGPSATACDYPMLASQVAREMEKDITPEAAQIAELAVRAALGESSTPDAARARLRAAIELAFKIAAKLSWKNPRLAPLLPHVEKLVLAVVDGDKAGMVGASGALLVATLAPGVKDCSLIGHPTKDAAGKTLNAAERPKLTDDEKKKRKSCTAILKATDLLTAVTAYAETYAKSSGKDVTEKDIAAVREERKAIIENFVDKVTVRVNRGGEAIWSLGVPVGFSAGYQKLRQETSAGSFEYGSVQTMRPQLSLSLGVAYQRLPGRGDGTSKPGTWGWNGLHGMLTVFDIGQLLAYDDNGTVARAKWESLFAPGLQVAWGFGKPQSLFLLGLEAKYSPTLFSDTAGVSGTATVGARTQGAVRYGVFLAYYVSFFDLN